MSGIGMPGSPVTVVGVRGADVIGGPGCVVMATVPGVVRSQPAVRPARINAAPATHTRVLTP